MSPRVIRFVALSAVLAALAAGARAGEPKVYRWVGEDGRVYTSNSPPPGGKGLIDAPRKPAPAPAPAAPARISLPRARTGVLPAAREPDADSCGRYGVYVAQWRDAQESIENWEATIERLESKTDGFIRRNDTAHHAALDRANDRLEEARDRASRVESEGRAAGMPQTCLVE